MYIFMNFECIEWFYESVKDEGYVLLIFGLIFLFLKILMWLLVVFKKKLKKIMVNIWMDVFK